MLSLFLGRLRRKIKLLWWLSESMIKYADEPLGHNIELINNTIVQKTVALPSEKAIVFMKAIVEHFIRNPDPMVVPLYSFNIFKKTYSYTMMRLGILSKKEEELIDFVGDMQDSYGAGACLQNKPYPNSEEYPELFDFLKTVTLQQRYWDIQSGNILMDSDGHYRLIDIEGFLNTPLDQSSNDWISRV